MKIEKYLTNCIHISYVKIYPQLDTNRHHTCKYHAKHVHMHHSDTIIPSDSSENRCSSSELFLFCPSRLSLFLSVGSGEFLLSGVTSKGGSKTLSVFGKLEQLQLYHIYSQQWPMGFQ